MTKKDRDSIIKIFKTEFSRFSKQILARLDRIHEKETRVGKTVDGIDIKLDLFYEHVNDLMELVKIHQEKIKYLEEQSRKTAQ